MKCSFVLKVELKITKLFHNFMLRKESEDLSI